MKAPSTMRQPRRVSHGDVGDEMEGQKAAGPGVREVYFGETDSGPSRSPVDGGYMGRVELDVWDGEARGASGWIREERVDAESTARREEVDGGFGPAVRAQVSSISRRPLRRPRKPGTSTALHRYSTTAIFFSLALLPFVVGVPPISRPPHLVPTSTMSPPAKRGVDYNPTPYTVPTGLPTGIVPLNETALPYLLTQIGDGSWSKIDHAWVMYGRSAGQKAEDLAANTTDPNTPDANSSDTSSAKNASTYAVTDAMPAGWGQTSSRTSFYKVPLIVVASVILAVMLSVLIIFIVLSRRKAGRKAKRRAERLRRKILLASGLTADGRNGSLTEAAINEKPVGMEQQPGKRRDLSHVRTKVRKWKAGLRRRNGAGVKHDNEQILETDVEEKSVEQATTAAPAILRRNSTTSIGSSIATPQPVTPDDPSPGRPSDNAHVENMSGAALCSPPVLPESTVHFPPAYRPASVRSYRRDENGSGSSLPRETLISSDTHSAAAMGIEKTRAPGYYPAPATVDAEIALAVATRSDGKHFLPELVDDHGDVEATGRMRHIATDDKRALEQIRLDASAPPLAPPIILDDDHSGGPSAPQIELDDAGFERMEVHLPPALLEEEERQPSLVNRALPAPPQRITQRTMPDHSHKNAVARLQELDMRHLIPSAPPIASGSIAPSAPPVVVDEEGNPRDAPSAPPLEVHQDHLEEMGDIGHVDVIPGDEEVHHAESERTNQERVALAVTGRRTLTFLPRYEP